MKNTLKKLDKYADYNELVASTKDTLTKVNAVFKSDIPKELEEWYKVYNGGNVFFIHFFSTESKIFGSANKLTLKSINSKKFKSEMNIPDEVKLFAQTNYGNYYCFVSDENTNHVYEYDCEKCSLVIKWNSFKDLLAEIIKEGAKDIKEGLIEKIEK